MGHWKRNLILWIVLLLVVATSVVYLLYQKRQREIEQAQKEAERRSILEYLVQEQPHPYSEQEKRAIQNELKYSDNEKANTSVNRDAILNDLLKN